MNQRIFSVKCILIFWGVFFPLIFIQADLKNSGLFQDGDYIKYDIHWSFLKIGTAELRFTEARLDNAKDKELNICFTVETNKIVDSIYPVENKVKSTLSFPELNPIKYRKQLNERHDKNDILITFDWDKRILQKTKDGQAEKPFKLLENTLDPLSLILSLCQNNFSSKRTLKQKVTDGGPIVEIEATYQSDLQLKTPRGYFDTRKISVSTKKLKGIFKKSPKAEVLLYLTKETPSIPIKLRSKVVVGHFDATLSEGLYQGKPIKGTWAETHPTKNLVDPRYDRLRLSPKYRGFKKR